VSEIRNELIKHYLDATEKYNYFIVGISAATFAYFAKPYAYTLPKSGEIVFDSALVMLFAIAFLMLSTVSGLATIYITNIKHEKNYKFVEVEDQVNTLYLKSENSDLTLPEKQSLINQAEQKKRVMALFASLLEKIALKAKVSHVLRDVFLVAGYLSLVTAKFLT